MANVHNICRSAWAFLKILQFSSLFLLKIFKSPFFALEVFSCLWAWIVFTFICFNTLLISMLHTGNSCVIFHWRERLSCWLVKHMLFTLVDSQHFLAIHFLVLSNPLEPIFSASTLPFLIMWPYFKSCTLTY